MSWLPFRKQAKKNQAEQLVDIEFESQTDFFNKIESNTRKSYKEVKRHVESSYALIKTQQRFANDLTINTCGKETDKRLYTASRDLHRSLMKQSEFHQELNSNIRKTFVEPMKRFSVNFATVSNAIKRREQSLIDYKKYLSRRDKFLEKETQSGKSDANERYLNLAKADFDRRNATLLQELPKFYECRMNYFKPCFEGLVRSQYEYYEKSRDIFEELAEKVDCPLEQWTDEEYRNETIKRLADIRALSIVV